MNGKIRTKLDNAYAAWEKKYKDVERYKDNNKTETDVQEEIQGTSEIVGLIYEAAKEPVQLYGRRLEGPSARPRQGRAPLLITTEKETCDKTLDFLHKNVATNITNENFAEQVNDNSVQLSAVLPQRARQSIGSNLDKDQRYN